MADQGLFAFLFLIKDNYLVENRPIKRENIIISHGNWLLRLELAFFSYHVIICAIVIIWENIIISHGNYLF